MLMLRSQSPSIHFADHVDNPTAISRTNCAASGAEIAQYSRIQQSQLRRQSAHDC